MNPRPCRSAKVRSLLQHPGYRRARSGLERDRDFAGDLLVQSLTAPPILILPIVAVRTFEEHQGSRRHQGVS